MANWAPVDCCPSSHTPGGARRVGNRMRRMNELCRLSATDAVALLKRREVSPLNLIDAAAARIEFPVPQSRWILAARATSPQRFISLAM